MDARAFERRLAELVKRQATDAANTASYKLDHCERCSNCVFCTRCDRCYKCSYCTECSSSSHLTHCTRVISCHHVSNSFDCTACTGSAYLTMCRDMSECNYCFGCVGLGRKDFHILNEPFERTEYFKIVGELKKQLRIPV